MKTQSDFTSTDCQGRGHADLIQTAKPFPDDEMHWFATTAYERSIAYNQSREDELCRKWMNHALSLAHYYRDGGVLEKVMQDNYTKLNWGQA